MNFYIDCEFDGHNGQLISMAIVSEYGNSIYIKVNYNYIIDDWVYDNVIPLLDKHGCQEVATVNIYDVGLVIRTFIGNLDYISITADSPVDIKYFCECLSTSSNGEWQPTNYKQILCFVKNVECYPTSLENAVQHNAWWDAMALREKLHEELFKL